MLEKDVTESRESGLFLPDVSRHTHASHQATLDRVGMSQIEIPLQVQIDESREAWVLGQAAAFVSLDSHSRRGIHMSRLYRIINEDLAAHKLTPVHLRTILGQMIQSQEESSLAQLRLRFDLPLRRSALLSEESGFRSYPFIIRARLDKNGFSSSIEFEILYSSTCPCSAALARELVADQFESSFAKSQNLSVEEVKSWLQKEENIIATPHAQRSRATIRVQLDDHALLKHFQELVDLSEKALGTPVQTAVKREDEQEFARLNAQNLMFCEDSARRLKHALEKDQRFTDYLIKVEHLESLHAHDAVAVVSKGIKGGLSPSEFQL